MFHRFLGVFLLLLIPAIVLTLVLFGIRPNLHSDTTLSIIHYHLPTLPTISINLSSPRTTTPDAFNQTIIEYNLFRPFGWRPSVPDPKYELLGITISHHPEHTKATI